MICWCCETNISWAAYTGTEHLGDDGRKPCFECHEEMCEADDQTLDFE